MAERVRLRLEIHGRVQGVWFRGSAREEAVRLGVAGWARNRGDGSVEILAQGSKANMDRFVAWCHRGPSAAHVTRVDEHAEPPGDDLAEFRIRY